MGDERIPASYSKNAPGPFYVRADECIACGYPESVAPDLMSHGCPGGHCYFAKQPITPEETDRAILAVRASCCKAVRYAGDDPKILKRLVDLGTRSSCDVLFDLKIESLTPSQRRGPLAKLLAKHLDPMWDPELDS